jgi:hypothetical protein
MRCITTGDMKSGTRDDDCELMREDTRRLVETLVFCRNNFLKAMLSLAEADLQAKLIAYTEKIKSGKRDRHTPYFAIDIRIPRGHDLRAWKARSYWSKSTLPG